MKKILFLLIILSEFITLSAQDYSAQFKIATNSTPKLLFLDDSKYMRTETTNVLHLNNHSFTKANARIIWSDDFNDLDISDWKVYDVDGDGYTWLVVQPVNAFGFPVGSPLITSASYVNGLGALTPDNWIVSPMIDLSNVEGEQITLKYGVFASDPDYNQENYAVYISTTDDITDDTNFKMLFTEFDLPSEETERTVDLTEYAGQKIHVTFRHFDTNDMYRINIDNVSIVAGVLDDDDDETSEGNHLFYDGFEDYDNFTIGGITEANNKGKIGEWIVVDLDKAYTYGIHSVSYPNYLDPKSFIVFNSTATIPALISTFVSDWSARTGEKTMTSFSGKIKNNDWLISPAITLGSSDNVLYFYAKAANVFFSYEEFKVLVSTTDTELSSFTEIASDVVSGLNKYTEYKYDLSAYNNKKIFLAIQCVSNDQYGFIIDDFTVDGNTELATSDINTKDITKVYPNPVQDSFSIDFGTSIEKSKVTLELYSFSGAKIKTFKVAKTYDISSLQKGIYILNITDGKTRIVKKIIKN